MPKETSPRHFERGPWELSGPVESGPSGGIAAADWTLRHLEQLGVRIPPGNRLARASRLLEEVNSGKHALTPDGEHLLKRVGDAQRTVTEQYMIARAVRRARSPTDDKLEEMLGGAEIEEDERNPIARNTQFELYVTAILAMGGATVTLAEPDILMVYDSEEVGVAAKRLSSPKQLRRRLEEGLKQIERSGRRGFVAINVDIFVKQMSAREDPAAVGSEFDKRLAEVHREAGRLAHKTTSLLGVLIFGYAAEWIFSEGEKPKLDMSSFQQHLLIADDASENERGERFFRELWARIDERLRNL